MGVWKTAQECVSDTVIWVLQGGAKAADMGGGSVPRGLKGPAPYLPPGLRQVRVPVVLRAGTGCNAGLNLLACYLWSYEGLLDHNSLG